MNITVLPKLPPQPPREWRASVALIASILGSVALTGFSGMLVYMLWQGGWPLDTSSERIHILGKALMLTLTGNLTVLLTLGFAINRRTIRVGKEGIDLAGGDDNSDNNTAILTATATITTPPGTTIAAPTVDTAPTATE